MQEDRRRFAEEVDALGKQVEALTVPRWLTIIVLTVFAVVAFVAWLLA